MCDLTGSDREWVAFVQHVERYRKSLIQRL